MRGNELLDKMELVDPSYVYAADQEMRPKASVWQKWGAVAACLGILLAGVLAVNGLPDTGNTPTPGSDETDVPMVLGTFYFKQESCDPLPFSGAYISEGPSKNLKGGRRFG